MNKWVLTFEMSLKEEYSAIRSTVRGQWVPGARSCVRQFTFLEQTGAASQTDADAGQERQSWSGRDASSTAKIPISLRPVIDIHCRHVLLLWPPCIADADVMFLPYRFVYLSSSLWSPMEYGRPLYFHPIVCSSSSFFFLFSSSNLSGRRLDVSQTFTHGVALVRI